MIGGGGKQTIGFLTGMQGCCIGLGKTGHTGCGGRGNGSCGIQTVITGGGHGILSTTFNGVGAGTHGANAAPVPHSIGSAQYPILLG